MQFTNELRLIFEELREIRRILKQIAQKEEDMAETLDQEVLDLQALGANMAVIKQGIVDLEAQISAAGTVTPAVQTALDALKASVADTQAALPAPVPTGT
jgi:hypothetical protein